MLKLLKIACLILILALVSPPVSAFETDQYNLSPEPLADIGDEVSEYAEENLRETLAQLNSEIRARLFCLEAEKTNSVKIKCGALPDERKKLDFLRSNDAAALYLFRRLGAGFIPFTKSGTWMNSHRFRAQPARYKTGYRQSIYAFVPTNYFTISPTVNIYGAELGTDKIAHFFQQGYDYYKIYQKARAQNMADAEATRKAVRWGRMTERTYYGTLVSGVYSNADLCANFAGLKFYRNLTGEIKIGDDTKAAILILDNGFWKIAEKNELRETLIKPFMTAHLNEALNPSIYVKGLRSAVRRIVKKNACSAWRKRFSVRSQAEFAAITQNLKLWNGEDYGFKKSDHFVTISGECFDK